MTSILIVLITLAVALLSLLITRDLKKPFAAQLIRVRSDRRRQ